MGWHVFIQKNSEEWINEVRKVGRSEALWVEVMALGQERDTKE